MTPKAHPSRPFGLLKSRRSRPPHVSLWALWSGVAEANRLVASEVCLVVERLGVSCVAPWARIDGRAPDGTGRGYIETLFGVDAATAAKATGADLIVEGVRLQRAWFHPTLSFCPVCMVDGYHTVVFQHRAVSRCPVHGATLRRACVACGEPVRATVLAAAITPFGCPSCGSSLARGVSAAPATDAQIEQRIGASRAAIAAGLSANADDRGSFALTPVRSDRPSASVRARRAARFGTWLDYDPYVARGVGLRTACVELDDGEVSPTDSCMGEHMDYRAWLLQWENALPGPYAVSSGIVSRLQWNPNDPALSEEVSVVAAALARLRLLYGGLPEERLGERFLKITTHHASKVTGFNPTPFAHRGVPCTTSLDANRILLHCELEALFAWLVVETRRAAKTRTSSSISWRAEPDATVFAPAWRIAREDGQRRLYYRPKVASATLARLVGGARGMMLRPS